MIDGIMDHSDSNGGGGSITNGDTQWMTAGAGILHIETPPEHLVVSGGLFHGFQLWVNLPARAKMTAPGYQEFGPDQVPLERWDDGTTVRVVAGTTAAGTRGAVRNDYVEPTYLDVTLTPGARFEQAVDAKDSAFVYAIEGELKVGQTGNGLPPRTLAVLGPGDRVVAQAGDEIARFLLVAAQPLGEPVARGRPFVMKTREEVLQAFDDYRNNRF